MNIEKFEKTLREGIEKFKAEGGKLVYGSFGGGVGTPCACAISCTFGRPSAGGMAGAAACLGIGVDEEGLIWEFIDGFDLINDRDRDSLLTKLGEKLRYEYTPESG